MKIITKWFFIISAIVWAIIAIIGFMIMIFAPSPPCSSVGEAIGVIGALGSWLSVLTGATWVQAQEIRDEVGSLRAELGAGVGSLRNEVGSLRDEVRELRKEVVTALREIRDLLRK